MSNENNFAKWDPVETARQIAHAAREQHRLAHISAKNTAFDFKKIIDRAWGVAKLLLGSFAIGIGSGHLFGEPSIDLRERILNLGISCVIIACGGALAKKGMEELTSDNRERLLSAAPSSYQPKCMEIRKKDMTPEQLFAYEQRKKAAKRESSWRELRRTKGFSK